MASETPTQPRRDLDHRKLADAALRCGRCTNDG